LFILLHALLVCCGCMNDRHFLIRTLYKDVVIDFNFNCMYMLRLHLPLTFLTYCLLCIVLVAAFDNFY